MAQEQGLFGFSTEGRLAGIASFGDDGGGATRGFFARPPMAIAANGQPDRTAQLQDQFVVFQLSKKMDGPALLESSAVEPEIGGGTDAPDMLADVSLMSFHLGGGEQVDPNARATMRLTFGKDPESSNRIFDNVFWTAAAGLRLYDQIKNKKPDPKELKVNLHQAFNRRPIEVPGGLGLLHFELVKHREPAWWQRVFKFAQGDVAQTLTAALGFPAITQQAIGMIDELMNRLVDNEPEVLFSSRPLRLALSRYARDELTGGNPRIRLGCLNPGFCILARGRDFERLRSEDVVYYPQLDRLAPGNVSEADLLSGKPHDAFDDITYAVFRVGMRATKLDPTFDYGA